MYLYPLLGLTPCANCEDCCEMLWCEHCRFFTCFESWRSCTSNYCAYDGWVAALVKPYPHPPLLPSPPTHPPTHPAPSPIPLGAWGGVMVREGSRGGWAPTFRVRMVRFARGVPC